MSDKKKDIFEMNDSFWDIDKMLPKKRSFSRFSSDTEAVKIDVPSSSNAKNEKSTWTTAERLDFAKKTLKMAQEKHNRYASAAFADKDFLKNHDFKEAVNADEPLLTYTPSCNPFIKEVTVKIWPSGYSFYQQFRSDAQRLYSKTGSECPSVPFFSYTPQYSQLSREQLKFYLYFRERLREGEPIPADYSYILLLIYEIINLPDIIPCEEGIKLFNTIWLTYTPSYPKLERHLFEWVCDYCLIHKLENPSLDKGFIRSASKTSSVKEYYLGLSESTGSPYANALFSNVSSYDYKTSKFYNEESAELFDKHIKASFIYAFTKAEKEGQTIFAPLGRSSMISHKISRDAYAGALCAYNVKRRIEISYLSCSHSVKLRYAVTDAVKFAENQVRAILGIRSRFHTPNLAMPLRNAIEEYFSPLKKERKKEMHPTPVPEYDSLYEPVQSEFTLSYAKEIEQRSWATTALLVEDTEEAAEETHEKAKTEPAFKNEEDNYIKDALSALTKNNIQAFLQIASENSLLPDALAEAINEKMYDIICDIAVTTENGGYSVIPDYMEEIQEWMKK